MKDNTLKVSVPEALEGVRIESDSVAAIWDFAPPMISFEPGDRGMTSGSKMAGWTWQHRHVRKEALSVLERGTVTADRFEAEGVGITREVFVSDHRSHMAVHGIIENDSDRALCLGDWAILEINDPAHLRLGDVPAGQWRMFRQGRHKNDHPAVVSLGRADDNYFDVAGRGSETGDLIEGGASLRLINDPMTVLKSGNGRGPGTLLLGFLSQLEHLSYIAVTMDATRTSLASLSAVCEFDGCLLPSGGRRETAWLLVDVDEDHFRSIGAYAEAVANLYGVPVPPPPKSVYCTWYFYGRADLTPQTMEDELQWFEAHRWPIDAIQIDSGWEPCFGDWHMREDWTGVRMERYASRIREMGYGPGIWTCPFIAAASSQLATEHPDWMLKDRRGAPVVFVMDGDNYVLDPTHPEVQRWLEALYHRLGRKWGYSYHKFDFTRAAAQAKDAVFHDPTATRAQAYRRGLETIRRALGDSAYMLICGGLYLPSIGIADGQRSGSDVKSRWTNPRADTRIRQNLLRYWMNRLWHQDPDALMVRRREEAYRGNPLSVGLLDEEEVRTLMVNQYLGGGLICFTERMGELDADRAALYRHCVPSLGVASVPADLFEEGRIPAIHVTRVRARAEGLPPWHTVTLINFQDDPRTFELTLDEHVLIPPPDRTDGRFLVWEFFERRLIGSVRWGEDLPPIAVPPHGTRVLRVAPWDGCSPALLATDRHLSMGGVEIAAWTARDGGIEVRIQSVWPDAFSVWLAVPDEDQPHGVRCVERRVVDGQRIVVPGGTGSPRDRSCASPR